MKGQLSKQFCSWGDKNALDRYIKKMENLTNQSKFQKTAVKDENFVNFITGQEKRIDKIYQKHVDSNSMSEETRRHLKPVGTRPGIMYGFL